MKAVRVHAYHQPPSIDDVPQPDLQSHHDVLVRIGGAGVCRTDLHVVDGWFQDLMPPEIPLTLGHENAGWVEAVGAAVTSVKVGDPVIVHPLHTCGTCWGCRTGEDMYCATSAFPGVNVAGGYAEYLRTSERSLVILPESIAPASVAPYADAGLTAYRAVRKASKILQPGMTVAVIGGGGGLGHIAIQLLREMTPARVVAIDKAETGRALATEVGAEVVVGPEDAAETIAELTGAIGADAVLDFVGEHDTPELALQVLRQGGTYYVVGYGAHLDVVTTELVLKEISIVGNLVGNYADLGELMRLVARDKVRLTTQTYTLDQAVQALDDLDNGRIRGRGVLIPS